MKLRIQGNSVRLRLNQADVRRMSVEGRVDAHVRFGPGPRQRLQYALEASDEVSDLDARYEPGRLTVLLPRPFLREWVETDRVGFETGGGDGNEGAGGLHLLVEKDFACLHREEEKQDPEAYPHPAARA